VEGRSWPWSAFPLERRLAIAGQAFLIGVDHYRIPHDHSDLASVLTDCDYWPVFVPPKLREREPIGTCTAYLSCAEIATPAAKTAIDIEILRLISVLFFTVASVLSQGW
jgi:hypothetical protein